MTTKIENDLLQRYFDDDLTAGEADELRAQLEESPEAAAELRELGQLRAVMRDGAKQWIDDFDSDELFARIQDALVEQPSKPALKVIRGSGRRPVLEGIAVGLAAAAAVLLVVFSRPSVDDPNGPPSPPTAQTQGSQVLEVDFGLNTGTVFAVKGAAGQPLAVVWIDDEVGLQ